MESEIITAATASATTKASGLLGVLTGLPTTLAAYNTGEWSAIAVGASVTGICGVFAVVGLLRDKQTDALRRQIVELIADAARERTRRKEAEETSDSWERRVHRIEAELDEVKAWKAANGCLNGPGCPNRRPAAGQAS